MEMVKVTYSGESALQEIDAKESKKAKKKVMRYRHNRCLEVSGRPYRMEPGVHEMPKADYEAFAKTPVGKILVERKVLKAEALKAPKPAKKETKPAKKPAAEKKGSKKGSKE